MPKLVKISKKIINIPSDPRFNTSDLGLLDFEFKKSAYRPRTLISPSVGLINDPCGIYYHNGFYYIQFQHSPIGTFHGLKFFSVAKTSNFVDYKYKWLNNQPDTELDSYGCYSGSAFKYRDNNIGLIYTGNVINSNNQRESNVVLAKLSNEATVIDKYKLLSNLIINNNANFRDPYYFKFRDSEYFVVGSQSADGVGEVLLFSINTSKKTYKLIKKLKVDNKFYMCECPNVVIFRQTLILIVCLQRHPIDQNDTRKTDFVAYFEISLNDFFNNKDLDLKNFKLFNYGFEYYAPQVFKDKSEYKVIGWSGLPSLANYPEALDEKWMNVLTPFRKMEYFNNDLYLRLLPEYVKELSNIKEKNVFVKNVNVKSGNFNHYWYDGDAMKLSVEYNEKDKYLTINRTNFPDGYLFDQLRKIKLKKTIKKITYLFDKSFFEIDIDNGLIVISGRLYANHEVKILGDGIDEYHP